MQLTDALDRDSVTTPFVERVGNVKTSGVEVASGSERLRLTTPASDEFVEHFEALHGTRSAWG